MNAHPPLDGCDFVRATRAVRDEIAQRHRFAHSVRVARLADRLAQRHGEDPASARLAGLLHDIARLYGAERLTAECASRGLAIDDFERRYPVVLHARLGAELARERFGISDPLVLDAIRRHTVAAPRMSRLDAIVYLADGLEPGRDFPEREAFERLAFVDLDRAMRAVLRSTLDHLRRHNLEAAPETLVCLNRYESLERTPLSA